MALLHRHLSWHVDGPPVPQKRHRHTHAGRTYDPCKQAKHLFLQQSRQACPVSQPLTGALHATLEFHFARPKSHVTPKGRLRKSAPVEHLQTPDIDNLIKYVFDALNGVYFMDDKQVIQVTALKRWAPVARTCVSFSSVASAAGSSASCPARLCESTGCASTSPPCPGRNKKRSRSCEAVAKRCQS